MMYAELEGKVAIVTGAGHGIGKSIASTLSKEKVIVVVNDIISDRAEKVAEDISKTGGKASAYQADVTKSVEINKMVNDTINEYGKIDILVNNAGASAGKKASFFHESEEETWKKVVTLNLIGTLICTRAVVNHMIERGEGKIVNISSTAGLDGLWARADYAAAKAGVIAFTKSLSQELGKYHINVNSVAPGAIETGVSNLIPKRLFPDPFRGIIPFERHGQPEEVADMVLFLVSEKSSYVTGECIRVSGGW